MKRYEPPLLTYMVHHSQDCLLLAERFLEQEMAGPDQDAWIVSAVPQRRLLVNKFQKMVMDIYCDPLFLETVTDPDEELDADMLSIHAIYQSFAPHYAAYDILAIVPMNLTGTLGLVLQHKSMTPKQKLKQ